MRCVERRARTHKWIEDNVARIATSSDDRLNKVEVFFCGISCNFDTLMMSVPEGVPIIRERKSLGRREIDLPPGVIVL